MVEYLKRSVVWASEAALALLGAAAVGVAILMPRIFDDTSLSETALDDDFADADAPGGGGNDRLCGSGGCGCGDGHGCSGACGGSCG